MISHPSCSSFKRVVFATWGLAWGLALSCRKKTFPCCGRRSEGERFSGSVSQADCSSRLPLLSVGVVRQEFQMDDPLDNITDHTDNITCLGCRSGFVSGSGLLAVHRHPPTDAYGCDLRRPPTSHRHFTTWSNQWKRRCLERRKVQTSERWSRIELLSRECSA